MAAKDSLSSSASGRVAAGVLSTAAWMVVSSALIIYNKQAYMQGLTFPFLITGLGQIFSAIGGLLIVSLGLLPLRPPPTTKFLLQCLLPIILSTAATMFTGNYAYLFLSVSFIQILKAFTPGLTLLIGVLCGIERISLPLAASVTMIAAGTGAAVLIESGTPAFHLVGFLSFFVSSLTEAARVIGAQILLDGERYNSAEALVYVSGPSGLLLLTCSALFEGDAVAARLPVVLTQHPSVLLAPCIASGLVNLTCFAAIQTTSSLTFKVAGCLKNLAVVWYSVAAHGDVVSPYQTGGYALSMAGFFLYAQVQAARSAQRRKAAGKEL